MVLHVRVHACTDTCGEADVELPVAEVKAVVSSLPGCEERNLGSLDAQQALFNQYPWRCPAIGVSKKLSG